MRAVSSLNRMDRSSRCILQRRPTSVDLSQLVALLANVATTVVAIAVAVRAGRAEAQQSIAAASCTEAAAALAEDNAQRIADAIRLLAQRPGELAAAQGARWSLRNFENDRYILANVGDAVAE